MKAKILVIRFSSIGDIVLTSPVLRCLHEQMDSTPQIHYLTKEKFKGLLATNPYVHTLHLLGNDFNACIKELKAENFDYIIDLHSNIRSGRVKRALKKLSFSVNKINLAKWIMVNFKINRLPKQHIVDRYLETLKAFGIKNDLKGLDFFIPPQDEVNSSEFGKEYSQNFIAFCIGGTYFTKKMPVEKIASICDKINTPVVLLGGKEDVEAAEKIQLFCKKKLLNLCGKYSVNQSASVIKQAQKVITHDTGMMHIAAAFNKEIISLWGNTIPDFGMTPYMPQNPQFSHIIEVPNLPCRPCSKLGHSNCPKQHFNCMQLINEDDVVRKLS
jgi:ADP-heptose:LPS heptosyltransferase